MVSAQYFKNEPTRWFFLNVLLKNWTVPMHALFSASPTVVISCSTKVIVHMVFTAQVTDAKILWSSAKYSGLKSFNSSPATAIEMNRNADRFYSKNIPSLVVCSRSLKSQSLKSSSLLLFCYFQKQCKSMLSGSVGVNISLLLNDLKQFNTVWKFTLKWINKLPKRFGAETVEESIHTLKMIPI